MNSDKPADQTNLRLATAAHEFSEDKKTTVKVSSQEKYLTATSDDILSVLGHNLELCLKKQKQVGFIIKEISEVLKK